MDNEDAHDSYSSVEVFFCFVLFCFIFFFKNDNVEEGTVFFYCNFPHYLLLVSPTPP